MFSASATSAAELSQDESKALDFDDEHNISVRDTSKRSRETQSILGLVHKLYVNQTRLTMKFNQRENEMIELRRENRQQEMTIESLRREQENMQEQINQLRNLILRQQPQSNTLYDQPERTISAQPSNKNIYRRKTLNPSIIRQDAVPGMSTDQDNSDIPGYNPRPISQVTTNKEKDSEMPGKILTVEKNQDRERQRERDREQSNHSLAPVVVPQPQSQVGTQRRPSSNSRKRLQTNQNSNQRHQSPTVARRPPTSTRQRSSVQTAERIRSSPLCVDGVKMLYKNREYQRWCVCHTDVCERHEKRTACGRASLGSIIRLPQNSLD